MNFLFKKRNTTLNYKKLDEFYLSLDKEKILRTNNINDIPNSEERRGGKISYAEWAHVIGLFQSLLYFQLDKHIDNHILDIGCGSGLLSMSSRPFIKPNGQYLGLDVMKKNIDFCKNHYYDSNTNFEHFDVNNSKYADKQQNSLIPWDLKDGSFDMVTALSVWTHLNEEHAVYYFKEIDRVLKSGGKAIVSLFYLDEGYRKTLNNRVDGKGKFHGTSQLRWVFNTNAYGSEHWFCPEWVKVPEDAIAIDKEGIRMILKETSLDLVHCYAGNWKEEVGFYFQDVLVFKKQ